MRWLVVFSRAHKIVLRAHFFDPPMKNSAIRSRNSTPSLDLSFLLRGVGYLSLAMAHAESETLRSLAYRVLKFESCLRAAWLARPLASVLCSRRTWAMEKSRERASFRQTQFNE
jgi:hypothetical protein